MTVATFLICEALELALLRLMWLAFWPHPRDDDE